MSPNGQGFLLNPDAPEGLTRFPQARSVPSGSRTIYIAGIASILPDGTVTGIEEGKVPDVRQQTTTILKAIDEIIKGASGGKGNVHNLIDAVVYLTEMERDYAGMNEIWNTSYGWREGLAGHTICGGGQGSSSGAGMIEKESEEKMELYESYSVSISAQTE
ncbi:hypothetical protein E4T50_09253 [Aureobasidium sp. EXF-12298]|nr:hypothetical protein E4T50_09253 [Aureobasidium sp. EXF-12298]